MTDRNNLNDDALEAMLSEMAHQNPVPSEALLQRVMADADSVITEARPEGTPQKSQKGFWTEIRQALGGWTAIAGLGTATIAGVWIGVVSPSSVTSVADLFQPAITTDELSVFTPDFDLLADEG